MKLVHTARDVPSAQFIRQLLEEQGIAAVVQGENLISVSPKASGTFPTIWVSNDEDWARACEVIAALKTPEPVQNVVSGGWICKKCGEHNEDTFSECWHCAKELDEEPKVSPQTRKLKTGLAAALFLALGCGFLSFFLSEMLPTEISDSQRWMRHFVSLTRLFAIFFCIIAFYFVVRLANASSPGRHSESHKVN